MSEKVCIFTGHRIIPYEYTESLRDLLDRGVAWAYEEGHRLFLCGGAMGFDRMAADAVLRARRKHKDIRLGILVPCRNQDEKWRDDEKRAYRKQLKAADEVEILSEAYHNGCMQVRNRALVDRADVCIAYMTSPRSGASQTVTMAREKGIAVYNLAVKLKASF